MLTTLKSWQKYLETLNPSRVELGLDRVRAVFKRINFAPAGKVIVIAGTNGKGSTVAALEAMLIAKGHSVGSYTSPHLLNFNERIRVNGLPAGDQDLINTFNDLESIRENTPLTYFEFMTLAGIVLLSKKAPDYFVFEVGLGGRLDAVNVLDADVSIVTGIALDHMDWLGNDIETIGFEKAGVYRTDKPAVFASEQRPKSVIGQINEIGAIPYLAEDQIRVRKAQTSNFYQINVSGIQHEFEVKTAALPAPSILAALTALVLLDVDVSLSCLTALEETSVAGRYQKLKIGNASCVLDVAHNPQAVDYLASRLSLDNGFSQSAVIVGLMSDKLLDELFVPMLPIAKHWLLVKPDIARAASIEDQCKYLLRLGVGEKNITEVGSVKDLIKYLVDFDNVVVYGSFYTVGEFLSLFGDMGD